MMQTASSAWPQSIAVAENIYIRTPTQSRHDQKIINVVLVKVLRYGRCHSQCSNAYLWGVLYSHLEEYSPANITNVKSRIPIWAFRSIHRITADSIEVGGAFSVPPSAALHPLGARILTTVDRRFGQSSWKILA